MQNSDIQTDSSPFNFFPLPRDIQGNESDYWIATMKDFYYDSSPTLAYLEGQPTTFSNLSFQNYLGNDFPSLKPDHLLELIIKDSNITAEELIVSAFRGEVISELNFELEGVNFNCNMIPLRLGNKVVGYKLQITKIIESVENSFGQMIIRKKRDELLRKVIQDLERSSDIMMKIFLAIMHDIRTPLSLVTLNLYFVKNHILKYESPLDPSVQARLTLIEDAIKRTAHMMEEGIGDFQAVNGNEVQMNFIDIRSEVKSVISMFDDLKFIKSPRGTHITIEPSFHNNIPDALFTYKDGFRRVLENLISNAIKYGHENSQSIINVEVSKEDNQLIVTVEDNGKGVPDEHVERLFVDYARAANAESTDGIGVGLVIVKKFVEIMNGDIRYEKSSSGGAKFIVKLPIKRTFVGIDES